MSKQNSRPRPTSADVAAHAGVSRTTVSMVLNGQDQSISEATRQRVRSSIAELGYIPNNNARSLRAGHSNVVLMPLPTYESYEITLRVVSALRAELETYGLQLIIDAGVEMPPIDAARRWIEYRPRVVFAPVSACDRPAAELLRREGVAGILLISDRPLRYASSLIMKRGLGQAAGEYLIEDQGHRNIAYLAPINRNIQNFAEVRYRELMQVADRHADVRVERVNLNLSAADIQLLIQNWLDTASLPSAVFAYNDSYALGLMQILRDANIRVPEDVTVVGADNTGLGRMALPSLTTVVLDVEEFAVQAAHDIHRLATGKPVGQRNRRGMNATVIERESSGGVRPTDIPLTDIPEELDGAAQ